MAEREATPMDQAVFDSTLAAELGKGTDRRVAEGRARSAAVRAYRKQHGEPERARPPAPATAPGDGGGDGGGAAERVAASAPAAAPTGAVAAAPVAAAVGPGAT